MATIDAYRGGYSFAPSAWKRKASDVPRRVVPSVRALELALEALRAEGWPKSAAAGEKETGGTTGAAVRGSVSEALGGSDHAAGFAPGQN